MNHDGITNNADCLHSISFVRCVRVWVLWFIHTHKRSVLHAIIGNDIIIYTEIQKLLCTLGNDDKKIDKKEQWWYSMTASKCVRAERGIGMLASKRRVHLPSIYSETERPMVMTETEEDWKRNKYTKKRDEYNNNNSTTISSSRSSSSGNDVGISKLLMFQICCTNLFASLFEVFFTRVFANVANTHTRTHIGMNWICNGIGKHHRHSSKKCVRERVSSGFEWMKFRLNPSEHMCTF